MALTGELNDLSLAELIEFFCNQRKTGRLKVIYPVGAGYFYLKAGAVIHATFGDLRGIEAVFYALTQPNASFNFSPSVEAPEHTINQPWTSVVLEGLRRMDEGVSFRPPSPDSLQEAPKAAPEPSKAVPEAAKAVAEAPKTIARETVDKATAAKQPARAATASATPSATKEETKDFGAMLAGSESQSFGGRRWNPVMIAAAVVVLVAVVGVPWGWYTHKKGARLASEASAATAQTPVAETVKNEAQAEPPAPQPEPTASGDAAEMAKREREARARERARAEHSSPGVANADPAPKPNQGGSNKRATVTVTYDENGRVTAASGGDATALRIARQKRFPPGKPGSATLTIPIN